MCPVTDATYVTMRAPSASRWTLDSAARLTGRHDAHYATSLPPVSVTAKVSGTGQRRKLSYRIARIPGQVVEFFERGKQWQHVIGRSAGEADF